MTWLVYELPTGKMSVHIPPVPSAGVSEGSSGGRVLPPLTLAHDHLARIVDTLSLPRNGAWYCEETEH